MRSSLDRFSPRIQRPERVPEQVVGIIELFDLPQPLPVGAKGSLDAFRRFMTSKELMQMLATSSQRINGSLLLTQGYGPPTLTGFSVSRIHYKKWM